MAFSAPACAATFVSTQQLGGDRLVFTITTDDTQGTLQTENLLSYTLKFRNYDLSGMGTGYQGGLYIATGTSPLIAEGSKLIFDSSTAGGLVLYADQGSTGLLLSSGTGGAASYERFIVNGTYEAAATLPGRFVLATALPEPSTWFMMLAGFAVAGGMLRHRRQKIITSAVAYG